MIRLLAIILLVAAVLVGLTYRWELSAYLSWGANCLFVIDMILAKYSPGRRSKIAKAFSPTGR